MFDKIYNKVWKVTTIPALKRFNSRSQSEVKANLYNKVKKIFDNSNKELTLDNLEAIILKVVNSKVTETSDRTLEQRLRRIEEKVSQKKRVTEASDDLYVLRKSVQRKLSEIASLMKRSSIFINNQLRDMGQSDAKLINIADQLRNDSNEYEDLI